MPFRIWLVSFFVTSPAYALSLDEAIPASLYKQEVTISLNNLKAYHRTYANIYLIAELPNKQKRSVVLVSDFRVSKFPVKINLEQVARALFQNLGSQGEITDLYLRVGLFQRWNRKPTAVAHSQVSLLSSSFLRGGDQSLQFRVVGRRANLDALLFFKGPFCYPEIIYLSRHREKESGDDPSLTLKGLEQAQRLVQAIGPVEAIVTSTRRRTWLTAAAACGFTGDYREISYDDFVEGCHQKGIMVVAYPDLTSKEVISDLQLKYCHKPLLMVSHSGEIPSFSLNLGLAQSLYVDGYKDLFILNFPENHAQLVEHKLLSE